MTHIERVEMPDGSVIYARVDKDTSGSSGVDVGLRDRFKLDNLGPTIQSVAATVHNSVAGLKPDTVSVEFGLELSLDAGKVVAVLASGGAKASLKVKLDWGPAAGSTGTPPE
ncbi:CU044_2847 family protein [Nocardia sp. NPDC051750]|uniref:CU044_2847 family protein n=1 Tax=Nocardia sp. NPDC051750 TaxID=3364325 RepID=UPI0037B1BB17